MPSAPHPLARRAPARARRTHGAWVALTVLSTLLAPTLGARADAQLARGDVVVAGAANLRDGALDYVDARAVVRTLTRFVGAFPHTVNVDRDNVDLLVTQGIAPYDLLRSTPNGIVTSVLNLGRLVHAIGQRETGELIVFGERAGGEILAVDENRSGVTTLITGLGVATAGAVDLHRGDYFFGIRSPGPNALLRAHARTHAVTTVVADLGGVPIAIASDWRSTDLLIAIAGPNGRVLEVDPTSSTVSTWFTAPFVQDIRVDRARDSAWVLIAQGPFGSLQQRDGTGRVVRTTSLLRLQGHYEIARYGGRALSGRGAAIGGSRYPIHLSLPEWPGRNYYLAASTGTVPDIRLPNIPPIPLRAEPLFFVSAANKLPILRRFRGSLDGAGRANAAIDVPVGLGGLRLFIAGAVIDANAPGGIAAMLEPIGITLK